MYLLYYYLYRMFRNICSFSLAEFISIVTFSTCTKVLVSAYDPQRGVIIGNFRICVSYWLLSAGR